MEPVLLREVLVSDRVELRPIGWVCSERSALEDDHWDSVAARIELDPEQFDEEALRGLDAFSHVEVVFLMHRVEPSSIVTGARHPRGEESWPRVGIFAQRAKHRPNCLGTTVCRVRAVEGLTLHVEGLDAVDATPVLDIKPWVQEFGPRGELKQPEWMSTLMRHYWA